MFTHEQLVAIFAEWERRATDGGWEGNERLPESSARVFAEIASELFPSSGQEK